MPPPTSTSVRRRRTQSGDVLLSPTTSYSVRRRRTQSDDVVLSPTTSSSVRRRRPQSDDVVLSPTTSTSVRRRPTVTSRRPCHVIRRVCRAAARRLNTDECTSTLFAAVAGADLGFVRGRWARQGSEGPKSLIVVRAKPR